MQIIRRKFKFTALTDFGIHREIPLYDQRIEKIIRKKSVNLIIMDGRTQTGKTTFARYLAEQYDINYNLFFNVEDIILYFQKEVKRVKEYIEKTGEYPEFQNRWVVYDEPQLDAPRQQFWDERNRVLSAFCSAYGFTHTHLIMCLPNIKGIQDSLLTNISLRMTIVSDLDRNDNIVRKALVKIPKFNEMRNRYFWTICQIHTIPFIEENWEYNKRKLQNFDEKLNEWQGMLIKRKEYGYSKPQFLIGDGITKPRNWV